MRASKFRAGWARQGDCVVGLKDKLKKYNEEHKEDGFHPLELTEGNVQAIFHRCLESKDTMSIARAVLFPIFLGYDRSEDIPIHFDQDILLKNKKAIMYLFGQISAVHTGKAKNEAQTIADFMMAYSGNNWTNNRGYLLELLYLGSNRETAILFPFNKEKGDITRIAPEVTPTLSPKDPAFPAWWEEHKSEWEA